MAVGGWKGAFWVLLVKQYQSASAVPPFRTIRAGLLLSKREVTLADGVSPQSAGAALSEEHPSSPRALPQLPDRGGPRSPGQMWNCGSFRAS